METTCMAQTAVGRKVRQKDGRPRVTGEARYYADVRFEHMLHVFILRSPYPQADIIRLNADPARALKGVHLVMTHENYPSVFRRTVHYVGDLVAAVVAESRDLAERAARLIEVEYERKPFVLDMDKEALPNWDASAVHHQWKGEYGALIEKKAIFDYE